MLKIRLSRGGKHKRPFFRIVVTEHSKPVKSGYKEVLGWYDPINHQIEADVEKIKQYISNGAQPSERTAKLLFNHSKDELFKKYYTLRESFKKTKKEEKAK